MRAATDRLPAIDVVVPTYNNLNELVRCLDALADQVHPPQAAYVCVDGSTDGTIEFLAAGRYSFHVIPLQHPDAANHGRARTRNLALPHLSATFVLLLDSDMWLEPGAIEAHVRCLNERDCISVGNVTYINEEVNIWARYLGTRGKNKAAPGSTIRPLDFVTANSAMRREHLLAVGGFEEALTGYGGEDTEFALRLSELGVPFVFNANARAKTAEPKTMEQGLRELGLFASTNLRTIRQRHSGSPPPFWIDRAESSRWADRAFRALLNPLTDRVVDFALPRSPWALQRELINYKVIRTVFRGYLGSGK